MKKLVIFFIGILFISPATAFGQQCFIKAGHPACFKKSDVEMLLDCFKIRDDNCVLSLVDSKRCFVWSIDKEGSITDSEMGWRKVRIRGTTFQVWTLSEYVVRK